MPSLKDRDLNAPVGSTAPSSNAASANPANRQTVALEVAVTVNGARQLEGSEKREPFSESTKTVLVFANGAVIRLGAAVAAGQLLFLTNEKTKKEVVCQVVKSKSYSNVSGYVELQFTEPAPGFWGVRLPADRAALAASEASLMESQPILSAAKMDAEQFKAELKADDRSSNRAALLTPAEPSTEALKVQANRLQEQLSTLMFAEQQAPKAEKPPQSSDRALSDTTAKLFEIAEAKETEKAGNSPTELAASNTPLAARTGLNAGKSTLQPEEVKIPAWLEPLARNADAPAEATEAAAAPHAKPPKEMKKPEGPKQAARPTSIKTKAATPASSAAVFGRTLLDQGAAPTGSHGSNKTLIFAIAAAIVIVAAGATWYLRQPSGSWPDSGSAASQPAPAAPSPSTAASAPAALQAPPSSAALAEPSANASQVTTPGDAGLRAVGPQPTSSAAAAAPINAQPAVISERVPQPASSVPASAVLDGGAEAVEPEARKAGLGKVRLAKPKVSRNKQAGVAAPSLDETGEQPAVPADASLGSVLIGVQNTPQPAAPTAPAPIGGDVKPAHLLSSVPPVYPPLAKTQHVAGDVRIDALIDATGRVSSMKVVSGPALLHTAAMSALRQWKYQPATLDSNPVSMHLTVTIQFRLQ